MKMLVDFLFYRSVQRLYDELEGEDSFPEVEQENGVKEYLFDRFRDEAEQDKVCQLKDIRCQALLAGDHIIYNYVVTYGYVTHPELAEKILATKPSCWQEWPDYLYKEFLDESKTP